MPEWIENNPNGSYSSFENYVDNECDSKYKIPAVNAAWIAAKFRICKMKRKEKLDKMKVHPDSLY